MDKPMRHLDAAAYDTDKASLAHYLRNYEKYFAPFLEKEIKLLELGVFKGGSLLMWRDFFEKGTIVGLDIKPCALEDATGRIRLYQGSQDDIALLDRIALENAPEGFDIIIDDCSHMGELTRISFWHLFRHHLRPGGIYAIEDWGTGYWGSWPDGKRYRPPRRPSVSYRLVSVLLRTIERATGRKVGARWERRLRKPSFYKQRFPSHDYGMVGFVKELIDEAGMGDITHPGVGAGVFRPSLFLSTHISHSHVIIEKARETDRSEARNPGMGPEAI
jgi:SAM-dependent methyltransferase